MYVLNRGPGMQAGVQTWVAGVCFTFDRYRNASGAPLWAAPFPDELDTDTRLAVLGAAARCPTLDVHKHDDLVLITNAPAPQTLTETGEEATPMSMALANGWTDEDLEGTYHLGDAGEDGGRSPTTGMTTGEMALTRPPSDWDELRGTKYPWDSGDWTPPTPLWTPPNPPAKASDTNSDDGLALRDVDLGIPANPGTTPDANDPAKASDTNSDDGLALRDVDLEIPANPGTTPDANDPAVTAGYPAEHVGQARLIVTQLAEKRGGPLTHPNQANFLLRRAELPSVNTEQLEGLQS